MLRASLVLTVLALAAAAGAPAHAAPKPASGARVQKAARPAPAVPFIEDDFGRALALAKARKLPVFIEGWAPW